MAKTQKTKTRAPSLHSRAARRAASPSLNLDKSIREITPPRANQSTFFAVQNGGIRKRSNKQLSRHQKLRHRKEVERADIVREQRDSKVQKSLQKLKTVKDRRKDWDDLNANIEAQNQKTKNGFAALADIFDSQGSGGNGVLDRGLNQANKKDKKGDTSVDGVVHGLPISAQSLPVRTVEETSLELEDEIL